MSIAAVDWAFRQTVGASAVKFLLVAMANYADEDSICYPSVRRLSADTEQDRKTILKNIAKLKELHLLEDTKERCGQTKSVPIYRLLTQSGPKNGTSTPKQSQKRDSQAVPNFPRSGPNFPPKRSQNWDTDPLRSVSDPPKGGFKAAQPPKSKLSAKDKFWMANAQLKNAKGPAKKTLESQQIAAYQEATGVKLPEPKPSVTPVIPSLPPPPPADPKTVEKLIAEAKAAVEAATPVRPNVKELRRMRYKRPEPPPAL